MSWLGGKGFGAVVGLSFHDPSMSYGHCFPLFRLHSTFFGILGYDFIVPLFVLFDYWSISRL